ncbi:hypothetical protein CGCFRS4_v014758 [Colletotrichum fructicola]|nr:hypothetical protein CGCFRS4_v014758 [Colletotrichum fructicola]
MFTNPVDEQGLELAVSAEQNEGAVKLRIQNRDSAKEEKSPLKGFELATSKTDKKNIECPTVTNQGTIHLSFLLTFCS